MTNTNSRVAPRNNAKQKRSKIKIELILNTALEMLVQDTADKITTNGIAKRAGIGIGSLYHFFPNKEAIFFELFKRWLKQTVDVLDGALDVMGEESTPEECAEIILDALGGHSTINSAGHWRLRRAVNSSPELAELEENHTQQIMGRLIEVQDRFNCAPHAGSQIDMAILQNQVSIACLQTLSLTDQSPNKAAVRKWCRNLLLFVFDADNFDIR